MGVVSPRGRVRIVSLVCLVMVSLTPHILSGWLLRPIVGFCEHSRGRCGVFSVQGSSCSLDVFEGQFYRSDARVRDGFVAC